MAGRFAFEQQLREPLVERLGLQRHRLGGGPSRTLPCLATACTAGSWCARQDSNLRPLAPEANALSS